MRISSLLTENLVFLDIPAHNKKEAITAVIGKLQEATGEIRNVERFTNQVLDRERLGSTGIGDEVAIPHARTDLVDRILIAFARTKQPVDFESLDGKPVSYLFLMAIPLKELRTYLATLASISRLIKTKSLREAMRRASTPGEFLSALREAEEEIGA